MQHLVNWYFGRICTGCGRIDMENENCGRKCYEKLQAIGKGIKVNEIRHKEFVRIAKSGLLCRPVKRAFPECPVCEALGTPRRRAVK